MHTRLCAVLISGMLLVLPLPAMSMVTLFQHPEREQLVLRLPEHMGQPEVRRIDKQALLIAWLGAKEWSRSMGDLPSLPSGLLASMGFEQQGLVIRTSTDAFGFVVQYDASSGLLKIDLFEDPLGSRWRVETPALQLQEEKSLFAQSAAPPKQPDPGSTGQPSAPAPATPPLDREAPPKETQSKAGTVKQGEGMRERVEMDQPMQTAPVSRLGNDEARSKTSLEWVLIAAIISVSLFFLAKTRKRAVKLWTRRMTHKHSDLLLTLGLGLAVAFLLYFIVFPRM